VSAISLMSWDVDGADVADELARHLLADGLHRADRAHHGQDSGGAGSGQVGVGATTHEVAQQRVQLG